MADGQAEVRAKTRHMQGRGKPQPHARGRQKLVPLLSRHAARHASSPATSQRSQSESDDGLGCSALLTMILDRDLVLAAVTAIQATLENVSICDDTDHFFLARAGGPPGARSVPTNRDH